MSEPGPFDGKSLDELIALRAKGRSRLLALEMGHLADMRVSAHYEPYAPDSFDILQRNEAQINKLRSALSRLNDAIREAEQAA